ADRDVVGRQGSLQSFGGELSIADGKFKQSLRSNIHGPFPCGVCPYPAGGTNRKAGRGPRTNEGRSVRRMIWACSRKHWASIERSSASASARASRISATSP